MPDDDDEALIDGVDGELCASEAHAGRITDDVCESAAQRHLRDMERVTAPFRAASLGFDHGAGRSIAQVKQGVGFRDMEQVTRSLGFANHGFNHNMERALGGIARMVNPTAGITDAIASLRGLGGASAVAGLMPDYKSVRDLSGVVGSMEATRGALGMLAKSSIADATFRHAGLIDNVSRSVSVASTYAIQDSAIIKGVFPHAWRAGLGGLTEFERVPQRAAFVPIARSRREAELHGDVDVVTSRVEFAPRKPPAPTTSERREPSRKEQKEELLRCLKALLLPMFEEVMFLVEAPYAHLPARTESQTLRAIDLIRWAESVERFDELVSVVREVLRRR